MLVDLHAIDAAQVEHVAARAHCARQWKRLGPSHSSDAHRHQPRRHLIVGNVPTQVAGQKKIDLLVRMLATIALAADDLERVHGRSGRPPGACPPPALNGLRVGRIYLYETSDLSALRRGRAGHNRASLIPLSAAASLAFRSALMRLSLPWKGERPIPSLAALN